jgi:hypothetical protein
MALLLLSLTAAPTGAQSDASTGAYPLGTGLWRVTFFIRDNTELGGVVFNYSGHGSSIIEVPENGPVTGEWNLSLRSSPVGEVATANGAATGFVTGDPLTQSLEFDQVTVTDAQFGIEITLSADELPDAGAGSLAVTGSGCNAVTGAWLIPFNGVFLRGSFIAQPLGTGVPLDQADLREEGQRLIEAARDGSINVGELRAFLAAAELQMDGNTGRRNDCTGEQAELFATAGTLLLDSVLIEAGYAVDELSDADFMEFWGLVLRSGLLLISDEARLTWEFELFERIGDAEVFGTIDDWRFWQPIAAQYGQDASAAAMARRICEEEGGGGCE